MLSPGVDSLPFIDKASDTLHVDINSCFATIEQQCNALLRGKPVVVAAYTTPRGCILSPSVEAKRFGIKTAMRVMEAKQLCPDVIVLPTDPWKYRWVNRQLELLLKSYTPQMQMKSIDEAVLCFAKGSDSRPSIVSSPRETGEPVAGNLGVDLVETAFDIRRRIRMEIGDWIMVSIGIGPNRWLAKMGAGLEKPNGLNELNWWNVETVLSGLQLEDLHGISRGNAGRLRRAGIVTPMDMYRADIPTLRQAFRSILGLQWHLKMRGYEVDDRSSPRQSFSHVYSLPQPARTEEELAAVISKMVHSLGYRIRRAGYRAKGMFVGLNYDGGDGWFHHSTGEQYLYDSADLYRAMMELVTRRPSRRPVRRVSSGCFGLEPATRMQTTHMEDVLRKRRRVAAIDTVQARFGKYAIMPARMLEVHNKGWLKDAISFGGIGELESLEFVEAEPEEIEDAEARFWEESI